MRTRLVGAALGLGATAALATYAMRNTDMLESATTRLFIVNQTRRQYPGLATVGRRPLDPTPFQAARAAVSAERWRAIARLVEGASIAELQRRLAEGSLTGEELALHYIERTLRLNSQLNAVVELNPDALTIARSLDAERRAGAVRGPLHGIPIMLKDNIATGDRMHTSAGARALSNASSDRDAFIADRLRRAGAVILGKNNMSEWAYYMSSRGVCGYSAVGGQTHHPLGQFEVGGSSSGSAAAVAAGLCAAAVGTETNGSLIYPASQHGIVTLKPSLGLVSRDRIIPITDAQDTAGPMARSIADAALLMQAIAGSDPNDPITDAGRETVADGFAPGAVGLRGLKVGLVRRALRPGDQQIYARAVHALQIAGAEVREIPAPPRIDSSDVLRCGFRRGVDAYLREMRGYANVASLAEVVAFNQADLQANAPYGQDLLEKALATQMTPEHYAERVRENRAAGARHIRSAMAEHKVDLIATLSNYLSSISAVPGFPALCLPAGQRPTGEPVGFTLIGDLFADSSLFSAAAALEVALGNGP
jgi:amidase